MASHGLPCSSTDATGHGTAGVLRSTLPAVSERGLAAAVFPDKRQQVAAHRGMDNITLWLSMQCLATALQLDWRTLLLGCWCDWIRHSSLPEQCRHQLHNGWRGCSFAAEQSASPRQPVRGHMATAHGFNEVSRLIRCSLCFVSSYTQRFAYHAAVAKWKSLCKML